MDRWEGKVAIVTGANSGIGKSIAKALIKNSLKVVGLDLNLEEMEKFGIEMKNEKGTIFPIYCDLLKEEDILKAFDWTKKELGGVDILANCAGICVKKPIIDTSTDAYKKIMDINLIAPAICTREAVKIMRENNTAGHIINISSVLGKSTSCAPGLFSNLYSPSKFALTAMSQVIEAELQSIESSIKITCVHPAVVKTAMTFGSIILQKYPYVDPEDIADGVIYALSTPPHVQIRDLTIVGVPNVRGKKQNN